MQAVAPTGSIGVSEQTRKFVEGYFQLKPLGPFALDRNLEDTLPYLFSLLGIVEGNDPLAQMGGQLRKRRTLEAIKRILLRAGGDAHGLC